MESPPNHAEFFDLAPIARGRASPVLQRRLELREQESKSSTPAPQPVQVILSRDLFGEHMPTRGPSNIATPAADHPFLLPSGAKPGQRLTIAEFCSQYCLTPTIQDRLMRNGYTGSHTFAHIKIADLRAMDFLFGEVAELQAAVESWSNHT